MAEKDIDVFETDSNVFVSAVLKANSLPFLVVRWIAPCAARRPLNRCAC
jgi:hypothetical protein